jgi:uncharacterized protein
VSINRDKFRAKYGPWAVVIGAAQGLGAEFSRQIAELGLSTVMVALEDDELGGLSGTLQRQYGIETRTVVGDITARDTQDQLVSATSDLDVGLVVYNAGLAVRGLWLDTSLSDHMRMIETNVRSPLLVLREFVPAMAARERGGIVLLSSMSGLQGSPLLATYAATKAYSLNLALSLWDELRPLGIDVTALVPGATDTPGFRESSPRTSRLTPKPMRVEPVVRAALEALGSRPAVVAGAANKAGSLLFGRLLPSRISTTFMGRTMRSMYGDDANPHVQSAHS